MSGIVIEPKTAAATYAFTLGAGERASFTAWGFSGSDAVTLQVRTMPADFANYVDSTGATVALSSTNNAGIVEGPFDGRWSKGSTTGAVGLRVTE